jgi:hypothetical protein
MSDRKEIYQSLVSTQRDPDDALLAFPDFDAMKTDAPNVLAPVVIFFANYFLQQLDLEL